MSNLRMRSSVLQEMHNGWRRSQCADEKDYVVGDSHLLI